MHVILINLIEKHVNLLCSQGTSHAFDSFVKSTCAHTLAIAHWYGEEFGLVDVESLNKEDQSRVRVRVNACHYN